MCLGERDESGCSETTEEVGRNDGRQKTGESGDRNGGHQLGGSKETKSESEELDGLGANFALEPGE